MGMNIVRSALNAKHDALSGTIKNDLNNTKGSLYPFAIGRVTNNTASFARTDAFASYPNGTELSMSYSGSGRYIFTVPNYLTGTLVAIATPTYIAASGTVHCVIDYTSSIKFTVNCISGSSLTPTYKDNDFTVMVSKLEGFI